MRSLDCTHCGSTLHWDGASEIVRCEYCGTEYRMHPREKDAGRETPGLGRGTAAGVPFGFVEGMDYQGKMPIESYIPAGWKAQCLPISLEYYGDYADNPLPIEAGFISPDQSVRVFFRSRNAYTDRRLSPIAVPMNQPIDFLGTNMRTGQPFSVEEYVRFLLERDVRPAEVRSVRTEEADAEERERWEKIRENYLSQGFTSVDVSWCREITGFLDSEGKEKTAVIESRLVDLRRGMKQPFNPGGFFGGIMNRAASGFEEHFWETQYEMLMVCDSSRFPEAYEEFMKINFSIRFRPVYEELKKNLMQFIQSEIMRAQQSISGAQMQMQRDRMASWDRMQGIINDTNQYTSGVMHQMMADNAASHDRMANLNSEMIREVNTYHTAQPGFGRPDVVEASTSWDHVYQSNSDPDVFAAAQGGFLEPGVDFEELKRTDGSY